MSALPIIVSGCWERRAPKARLVGEDWVRWTLLRHLQIAGKSWYVDGTALSGKPAPGTAAKAVGMVTTRRIGAICNDALRPDRLGYGYS
jgi:hypothetical protein